MLAPAAAGSVFEIGVSVHRLSVFSFFLLRKVLSLFLSGCNSLAGDSLCSGPNGPDEAQQFTSNCGGDFSPIFAGCAQSHIAFVQPVLRFPRNLLGLLRNALLPSAQSIPNTWWTTIAPRCFDDDSSQVCVAGLGDAPASHSLSTGVFAGYSTAITHQLPSTLKAGHLAQLGRDGYSRDIRDAPQCL